MEGVRAHTIQRTYIDAHRRRAIVAANWPCPLKMLHLNVHGLLHTHEHYTQLFAENKVGSPPKVVAPTLEPKLDAAMEETFCDSCLIARPVGDKCVC